MVSFVSWATRLLDGLLTALCGNTPGGGGVYECRGGANGTKFLIGPTPGTKKKTNIPERNLKSPFIPIKKLIELVTETHAIV